MSDGMTDEEHTALMSLRNEVRKDIALAIANFKVWLLITVLSNVVMVGFPALYVFFNTSSVASASMELSITNNRRLDKHRDHMTGEATRMRDIEKYLADKYGYQPREDDQLSM